MEIESRLRDALPQHELLLAYQPILRLAGGQAIGCEALVRWRPTGERARRERARCCHRRSCRPPRRAS